MSMSKTSPYLGISRDQRPSLARKAQDKSSPGEERLSHEDLFPLCSPKMKFKQTKSIYDAVLSVENQWLIRCIRAGTLTSLKEKENLIFANNLDHFSFIFVMSVSVLMWFELNFSFNFFFGWLPAYKLYYLLRSTKCSL